MNTQNDHISQPQNSEISACELTTLELDGASGGIKNNQTEAWAAFQNGMLKGIIEGGGKLSCWMD
jgi:hypothetical protein